MKNILLLVFAFVSVTAAADLWVTPRWIDFGRVDVDGIAPSRTITVRNVGNEVAEVDIRTSFCRSEFWITDNCYWELEPHDSCTIRVRYQPRVSGHHDCDINIEDNHFNWERVRVSGQAFERRWRSQAH